MGAAAYGLGVGAVGVTGVIGMVLPYVFIIIGVADNGRVNTVALPP